MTLFTALRSLIFMLAFYVGTAFFVLAAVIGGMFKPAHVQSAATGWSRFHRLCVRWILGQRIVVDGDLPIGPYLYIMNRCSRRSTCSACSTGR
jgi:1-acyl-sn-glycerol-3-phosphate acyltransferase